MDSLQQTHPELPICPAECIVTGMDLHISVEHPVIHEVVIDCFDIGLFSKTIEDMKSAYSTVIQITDFLKRIKDGV